MASNPESKFLPFTLHLDNHATITGLKYIPELPYASSTVNQPSRPLLILIHGGTCTAHNFDVSPSLTAATYASQFSVPVISINRPGYLDSPALAIKPDSSYHKTLGQFNHTTLFPALWRAFGQPNSCTALVPLAHSLGSPGIIIASALHATDSSPSYPLAGIIFSGWGIRTLPDSPPSPTDGDPVKKLAWKRLIMLGDSKFDCAPPDAYAAIELQDHHMDPAETHELRTGIWKSYWREYSDRIAVPVMWALGEHERFWEASLDHVKEFEACFSRAPRFDASLVLGAPHAIEWSWYAKGWYARSFGFATEVTEWLARREKRSEA